MWKLLLGADACLILLFLAGYAARFVHPANLWGLQVIAIGLPVLSVLVLTVGLTIAWGRPQWLIVHGLCGLLIIVRFAPAWFTSADKETNTVLKVLSYNVKLSQRGVSEHEFEELVRQLSPDVIGLQETQITHLGQSQAIVLEPQARIVLSMGRYVMPSLESRMGMRLTHQPIFSAVPVSDSTLKTWPSVAGDRSRSVVTRAQLRWAGRDVAVYNVHLRSFYSKGRSDPAQFPWASPRNWLRLLTSLRDDFRIRAAEAEQVRQLLDQEALPFILCGDFNSTPDQWVYTHLTSGFQDAYHRAGKIMGPTYHRRWPIIRIDYIILSSEWRVHSAQVIRADISDHLPLTARLSLAAEATTRVNE